MGSVTEPTLAYKPFSHEWAFDLYKLQNQVHWMVDEIPMGDDVADWKRKLPKEEKNLITQIFKFFTAADKAVHEAYLTKYMNRFQNGEVQMMLSSFANMENIHMHAYEHLVATLGMSDDIHQEFLEIPTLKKLHDFLGQQTMETVENTLVSMAIFGAFTEGLQLYGSFAMLMDFPRRGLMKGMGQVVTYSVRDEAIHVEGIIRLFHEFLNENPKYWNDKTKKRIYDACRYVVEAELDFIDLAYELYPAEDKGTRLKNDDIKEYIKYVADGRLLQLGLKPEYGVTKNPLPWMDEMINAPELANFFEQRVTEYSKGALQGNWEDSYLDNFTVYTTAGCSYCEKIKKLIAERGYTVKYIEVNNPPHKQKIKDELSWSSFPIVLQGEKLVGGFAEFKALM